MPRFRNKPREIEADQWFYGKPVKGVVDAVGPINSGGEIWPASATVITIQGQLTTVQEGEWVIMEDDGVHAYPCDNAVFIKQYVPVE